MSDRFDCTHHADVSLLLRAHAEEQWLKSEVAPVLRQLETREDLPEEQLAAAEAYLEVVWIEARRRAQATDAAGLRLEERGNAGDPVSTKARHCHAAVRVLRDILTPRVRSLLDVPEDDGERVWAEIHRC
ncbi:MAG TPA: hypothetical protein VGX16_06630 [Solirubrobacteraceae bacterium]|jgi:hypothetical protein|nr:hypothetical protein [Solirubrobacteraceae bacterium]